MVLVSRVPYPLEKGDKLRAFNQIKRLSRNHSVHLIALNDSKLHPEAVSTLTQYCTSIRILPLSRITTIFNLFRTIFTDLPFQVGYFFDKKAKTDIQEEIRKIQPDLIFCQLIRMTEYVNESPIPKVLDYMDVFSKGFKRRAEKASVLLKPLLWMEYKRLLRYERQVISLYNEKIIISEQDRAFIPHSGNMQIQVIPNGVDLDYFSPRETTKKYDLVFTGNMGYAPNVDSVVYLVQKILPLVRKEIPGITLLVAGADPAPKVLALRSGEVTVTGWVDDIRDAYASSKIFIAPMQLGSGLQNKLLEAMAMRLPCITSSLAAKALGTLSPGSVFIARSEAEYAHCVLQLLRDQAAADELARNGYEFVRSRFNWDLINTKLEKIFGQTVTACLEKTAGEISQL